MPAVRRGLFPAWTIPGGPENTIFVDPTAPGNLQTTAFVGPAAPRSLQIITSVVPTPPGLSQWPPKAQGSVWKGSGKDPERAQMPSKTFLEPLGDHWDQLLQYSRRLRTPAGSQCLQIRPLFPTPSRSMSSSISRSLERSASNFD